MRMKADVMFQTPNRRADKGVTDRGKGESTIRDVSQECRVQSCCRLRTRLTLSAWGRIYLCTGTRVEDVARSVDGSRGSDQQQPSWQQTVWDVCPRARARVARRQHRFELKALFCCSTYSC